MKKIISIITVVIISFYMSVNVFAVSEILLAILAAGAKVITGVVVGAAGTIAAEYLAEGIVDESDTYFNETLPNITAVYANGLTGQNNESPIKIIPVNDTYKVTVNTNVVLQNSPEYEYFYNITEYMNKNGKLSEILDSISLGTSVGDTVKANIKASEYAALKQEAVDAVVQTVFAKTEQDGIISLFQALDETGNSPWNQTVLQTAEVRPFTQINLPVGISTSLGDIESDSGYMLYSPIIIPNGTGDNWAQSAANANAYRFNTFRTDFMAPNLPIQFFSLDGYNNLYGSYIIYNGDIFYLPERSDRITSHNFTDGWVSSYINSNGISLYDLGVTTVAGLRGGLYRRNSAELPERPTTNINENEFDISTGGGTVALPQNDVDNLFDELIGAGVLPQNINLDIDDQGNIVGANGITLADLQILLENLKANINDSNLTMESYLALLTTLVSTSNLTQSQQVDLLNNINTNLLALSAAVTAEAELDIDKDNFEYDTYLFQHYGLAEANAFVNNMSLVQQCRTFISNLMTGFSSPGNGSFVPPNFHFYWDSNKDGYKERYCWLDLSFLETPLTNANLEDKGRFTYNLTVRDFLQGLIVVIFYTAFFIKMIRKLPALFGGVESVSDDLYNGSSRS